VAAAALAAACASSASDAPRPPRLRLPPPAGAPSAGSSADDPVEQHLARIGLRSAEDRAAHARALRLALLQPAIVDWPIVWNAERMHLMDLYLEVHRGSSPGGDADAATQMDPRLVVIHWTAGGSAKSAWHTFRAPRQTGQRIKTEWNAVNLSSHFVVDRDGTIFRLMPETRMGRHTIGLNHLAIGIENVGDGKRLPLTEAQLEANAALIRWLAHRHPITHLIGHHEYRQMESHPYFSETLDWFRTGRVDPGPAFMARLRARLADLPLQGPPERGPAR
jgi:hypothetical protein